jgi:hypothetical protein
MAGLFVALLRALVRVNWFCMKWTESIHRWRGLNPEARQQIRWQRIPRQVALSMSFEKEAVDLLWLETLHRQMEPPVTYKPREDS